jgi:hypothetical protein
MHAKAPDFDVLQSQALLLCAQMKKVFDCCAQF